MDSHPNGSVTEVRKASWLVTWKSYLLALAISMVWLPIYNLIFDPGQTPMIQVFLLPVLISAFFGGLGPGLVATFVVALLTNYYLLPPFHSLHIERPIDIARWLVMALIGAIISLLNESLHQARRRAENAMNQYNITLESIGDAVITTDAKGRVNFLNAEAERLTGWKNDEAKDQLLPVVFRIFNEHSREVVENPVEKVLRTGAIVGLANHTVLVARDNREIIIDDSAAPIRRHTGEITGVVLVFRDNTEKKRAEDAVQQSQSLYSSLVDQMPAGVFRKDAEGRYVFVNSLFCELKGMTPEQFLGKTALELEIADQVLSGAGANHHEQIMQTGRTIAAEETHIRSDGKRIYFQAVKTPVFDSDGKVKGSQGILFNITPRKEAEAAAAESQLLYHSLVNQMPAGIFRKNAEGRYVFVNPFFCELRQATPDKFIGKLPSELANVEDAFKADAAHHHQQIMQTGCTINVLDKYQRADGRTFFFQVVKTPVRNTEGKISGSQGILFDITQNKRTEDQLGEIIRHTRCIVSSGLVSGPDGWREHATDAESPFVWAFSVVDAQTAQMVLPLELLPGESYDQAWKRRRHPDDHIEMNRNSGQALLTGATFYRNEFRCTDKHGNLHWMQQQVTVEPVSENQWRIFGVTTDITELKSTQELYKVLFDASPAGFVRQDENGKIIDANQSICQMTGYSREELIGRSVEILAAPRSARLVTDHLQKIRAGGVHIHEVENLTKSGQPFFVRIVETCIQFRDGHREILCNITNITERKQAEFLLESQKEILEMVATGRPQKEVLEALCHFVESHNPDLLASLLLLETDEKHLRHGAASSLPEAYCRAIDGVEIGPEVGSCGTAAFYGKQVIVENIASDPLWKNFSSLAAKYDLNACWSTPIFDSQKKLLGTFAIYSRKPASPTPGQLRLISIVTHIAALVLSKNKEQAQLNRLAAIVESSDDAIISKSLDGIITSWNHGAELIYGYTAEEAIGQPLLMLYPKNRVHEEQEILNKVSSGQNVVHFETVRVRKDGREIDVSVTISPLKDEHGEIIGASKVARDITARKKADAAVVAERARFRLIFENAPVGIAFNTTHPNGAVTRNVNDAFLRIAGLTREQHNVPDIYQKITHPDDRADQNDCVEQVNAGRIKQYSLEKRYLHPGDKTVWVNFVYQREIYADDTIEELTTVVDITALKEALHEVAREQSRFKLIFDSIPIGVAFHTIHPDGSVTRNVNNAHLKICDITREQSNDTSIYSQITHPEDRLKQLKLVEAMGSEVCRQFSIEKRYVRKNHSITWASLMLQRATHPDGTIEELTTIADITEHKRLEEQLRQSQKMEAIGQLSGGIAHDFNNILTAILGNATLLSDPEITHSEAQECLQEIVRAARRAADLTRQLLLFSRKQAMQPALVDLNQIVSRSTKMLQRILGEDITLRTEFAQGLPAVSADGSMIEQAILNLAVNARDAMPSGGQLKVCTAVANLASPDAPEKTAPAPHICLTIGDDGNGIPPEILPRIFEPFFTTKEVGKGTGLGLATVYGIVKQHNGWITVNSEPGQGTEFKIFLPAISDHAAPLPAAPMIGRLPRGTGTILVAEDEPPVRSLVCHLLHRLGYQVIEAVNGNEALELWQKNRDQISLVLTDVIMPGGMSGPQLAAKILAEAPETKIIFNSGYTGSPTEDGVPLVEGKNFIRKPFSPDALASLIHRTLNETKSED